MDNGKIFLHDRSIQKSVSWQLSRLKDFETASGITPAELLAVFSPAFLGDCETGAGKPIPIYLALYYLLLEHRRFMPSFYPPYDICLLLANLAKAEAGAKRLIILDSRLVAVAVLLAGSFREIALPKTADAVRPVLASYIKDSEISPLPKMPDEDALVLAGDPRVCLEEGYEGFALRARSAIFLANWDFFGVKTREAYRRYWLEKSGITGILQLPRLKRQGSAAYPAIMRIGREASDFIRMARIDKVEAVQDAINQEQALALMQNAPDAAHSRDVEKRAINAHPSCNLSPALWLNARHRIRSESGMLLGKCVQIIRCQLMRIKIPDNPDLVFGMQEDGSCIARETGMSAFQAKCGILLDGCGAPVKLEFKRRGSQFKYLLRKNDIIFSFRGTTESVGKVGFAESEPSIPTITGTAFCILRPLADINPVWLFWHLQSREIRNAILSRCFGTTMLNIGMDDLGSLPIRMPKEEELKEILALHSQMARETLAISAAMSKISGILPQMTSLIN